MTTKTPPRRAGRPAAQTKAVTIQVRISAAEAESLRKQANKEDRPVSNFVRKVLRQAIGSVAA